MISSQAFRTDNRPVYSFSSLVVFRPLSWRSPLNPPGTRPCPSDREVTSCHLSEHGPRLFSIPGPPPQTPGTMSVPEILGDIVRFVKGKGPDGVHIDNRLFQLHYRLTTFIFLGEGAPAKVSRSQLMSGEIAGGKTHTGNSRPDALCPAGSV